MATKFSVFSILNMGSNSSRILRRDFNMWFDANKTWGFGYRDPNDFTREFRRNQANMERALTDLSYIFVKIFLWATIYAVISEITRITFKWARNLCRQRKETRERQAPEAERPTNDIPQRQLGPTML